MRQNNMKIIGITGGVGAGKTTVVDILKTHYEVVFLCCDTIAHDLMKKGNVAYEQIVSHYGENILGSDGEIDRKKLSEEAFLKEGGTAFLNRIVHPLVRMEVDAKIAACKQAEYRGMILVEAALLLEAGYHDICDEIWYVYASEETRRERLRNNRGYSEEKITALFQKQYTEEQFKAGCDFIIKNETEEKQTQGTVLEQIQKHLR